MRRAVDAGRRQFRPDAPELRRRARRFKTNEWRERPTLMYQNKRTHRRVEERFSSNSSTETLFDVYPDHSFFSLSNATRIFGKISIRQFDYMEKSVVHEVSITKVPIKKEILSDDIKVRYK